MAARTGGQYLEGLRRPRSIWVGDGKVDDVVDHPAFAGAAHALAGVFDLQHERADVCLMPDPETGELINISHMLPRSREDLIVRHACLEATAEYTVGLMGRTPDFLNVIFGGFAATPSIWVNGNDDRWAENILNYQKLIRRKDLALTHALNSPTAAQVAGSSATYGSDILLRKVGDTQHGIIVRGSRVMATLAPFADEITCYPLYPLPEGAEAHAVAFAIPTDTPGLTFVCRDSVAGSRNNFDHPLSSRFDEQDALVIFDDVEIPRDRIFVDGNLAIYNGGSRSRAGGNAMQQSMIRAHTKLEFAYALALRMVEAIGIGSPQVDDMIGELWCYCELTRCAIATAEANSFEAIDGAWFPESEPMHALRCLMPTWIPRLNEIFRLIGSHNLLSTPTAAQLADPELGPLLSHYLRGAEGFTTEQRVRIFRLAWDFVGSGLGSRNEQYERFYLASGSRNRQFTSRMVGVSDRANRLVDRFLNEPQ